MKKLLFILSVCFLFVNTSYAQSIKGYVKNANNEALTGAVIRIENTYRTTVSDNKGFFEFKNLKAGNYVLIIKFIGYQTQKKEVILNSELKPLNIVLALAENLTDEVMVKATRAGTNTPVASTIIDKNQLSKTNLGQDLPVLLSLSPSITYSSDAGTGIGYTKLYIRGTDITRINVTANGIPLNDAESHGVWWVNMPDLVSSVDDIEIQRGVGTSTNGAAAFGANINIKTIGLNKTPYANLSTSYGSFNSYKNQISVGSGLINNHFSFDLRLSKIYSDGFVDRAFADLKSFYLSGGYSDQKTLIKLNIISGKEKTYQAWWGVPKVRLENDFAGMQRYRDHYLYTEEQYQHMLNSDSRSYNYYTYDNEVDNYGQDHYQLLFSRELIGDLSLNLALNYTHGEGYYEQYKNNQDLVDYGISPVITAKQDTISSTDLIRRKWLNNDFYAAVFSVNYQKSAFNATLGGAYTDYFGKHYGNVIWARFAGESEIRHQWYYNTGDKQDFNLYGKFNYTFMGKINTYIDLQYRTIDYVMQGEDDDLSDLSQNHNFDFFNPKAGLSYQIDDEQNAYFSVGVAHREPSRTDFKDAITNETPKPERLIDYELGYDLNINNAHININLYYMDYTNQLVNTGKINNVGNAIMTNMPESYRSGVELSGAFRFYKIIDWQVNATFSKNKIKNFTEYVDDWDNWGQQIATNLGETDISFSPNIIMGSNLSITPFKDFSISLQSKFVSKQYIDNTSSKDRMLDAYTVSNLSLNYRLKTKLIKNIDFKFIINNVFNEEYETNAWVYRYSYGGEYYNMDGYFPQAGINFMGGIVLNF